MIFTTFFGGFGAKLFILVCAGLALSGPDLSKSTTGLYSVADIYAISDRIKGHLRVLKLKNESSERKIT